MRDQPYNVLFICTGNSARSVMSEGVLNVAGQGRFQCYSAGSNPSGRVDPNALSLLQSIGYDTSTARSKSWDEFSGPGVPQMDLIITVCSNAREAVCPIWPGHPATAHWGYDNPGGETEVEKRAAMAKIFAQIQRRTEFFLSLASEPLSLERVKDMARQAAEFTVE